MPWDDDAGPVPRRSEEELLALARAKSEALVRRRRWELGGGILTTVLLLVGVTAVLLEGGDDRPTEVRTASGGWHAATTVGAPTTTEPPSATTTVVAPVLPSPISTTTRPTTATSTTPSPTVPAGLDDSATTTVPWVYCEVSNYDVRVTTDKPVYQLGEVVRATISVTNNSDRECYTSGFRNSGASVFDAAGNNLGGVFTHGDCVGDLPCGDRFSPGTTKTASWCWSQQLDGAQPAPAGTYRMEILWQGASGEALIQTSGLPPAPTTTSNVYGIRPC